jgi:fructose-1,6-bisphosphatase/inositol monophosphatase family enzyme
MSLPGSPAGESALDVARACADEASAIMRANLGRVGVASVKGRGNVVTEVDLAVEHAVRSRIHGAFPDHAILSEETGAGERSDGWMWVVDPLDGTKNFSRGIPHFCFSIALCYENAPVVALIRHPLLDETFAAVKGAGATLNGDPMQVSDVASVKDSVVGIDLGYDDRRAGRQIDLARHLWPGMQSLRIAGSAALGLAFVAAGRWDVFAHMDLQPWDSAAGLLLVQEAGGVVTDRDGSEATIFSRALVAGNPPVYADFMRLASGQPWQA